MKLTWGNPMKLTRLRRVRNKIVADLIVARDEFDAADRKLMAAQAETIRHVEAVLKIYVPLKNAVSDADWSIKRVVRVKPVNNGANLEVTLHSPIYVEIYGQQMETFKESFWKIPSWMVGSTPDRIQQGLIDQLAEQSLRYQVADNVDTEAE